MKKLVHRLFFICLAVLALYGTGRLYYQVTGGFTEFNISSDFSFQPGWEVRLLSKNEEAEASQAFNQSYRYLGKGCQSYVFASDDGKYVIKFFKYQRYRLQPWLNFFPPLPSLVKYRQEKLEKKWKKLDGFVKSWKVAFENLKEETGLVFVHLNKTNGLKKSVSIYDKIGKRHEIDLDEMEFCIQHKAKMLCEQLLEDKSEGNLARSKQLINDLLNMILSEYRRGLADNDHALMQNTGVSNGKPVHIDVGQFVFNDEIKNPSVSNQELYTKTYKFKLWLHENYPELGSFLEEELRKIIGPQYETMQPKWRKK